MNPKDLEQLPLFAGLDKRERARVAQQADEVDVSAGRRLAVEGDLAYEFFVIREGTAEVDVGGEIKATLGPGDFFGEIGVLESEHRRVASVTATTPMKLIVITGHDLRAINRDLPEVASKLRAAIQERVGGRAS
jgi:CRP/FNR family transcriptional regulator, cyclic AMP receptor protein